MTIRINRREVMGAALGAAATGGVAAATGGVAAAAVASTAIASAPAGAAQTTPDLRMLYRKLHLRTDDECCISYVACDDQSSPK